MRAFLLRETLLTTNVFKVALVAMACATAPAALQAGEYNETLKIGDSVPAWKDLPGVDDKQHALADLKDNAVVVFFFTCNSCPVATDYEDRTIALAAKYQSQGVAFVAANVNRVADDSLEKMKLRAAEKKLPYPYLLDTSQNIAKDYGAAFTPEFFVLDKDRKLAYMGSLDDNSNAELVKQPYLDLAIAATLAGKKPVKTETPPIGCRIRYARRRD